MSDENTTPRRVDPTGPVPEDRVPEDRVPEPEATDRAEETGDTVLLGQQASTTELSTPPADSSPAEPTAFPAPAPQRTASPGLVTPPGGLVTVRTGPRPGAIMLGLLCLLVAAFTMVRQTTHWRFDLSLVGPISFGALGTLLLLVGLVGLLTRRRS
jgi:hypothetical protein